jgi:uncharacterized protein (TIGR02145 family)
MVSIDKTRIHLISFICVFILVACTKSTNNNNPTIPELVNPITTDIINKSNTTITIKASINSAGSESVTDKGICWSTNHNPTIADNKISNGSGTSDFTSTLTGLLQNTTYYLRVYAANRIGIGYSNEIVVTTNNGYIYDGITFDSVLSVTDNSITCSYYASWNSLNQRGLCCVVGTFPELRDVLTHSNNDGISLGRFTSTITGLTPGTTYYLGAYLIHHGTDTVYGYGRSADNNLKVKTSDVLPTCGTITDIDGNTYHTVQLGTQCWTVENLKTSRYKDGTNILTGLSNLDWENNTTGAYAVYKDSAIYNNIYGKLYNWYAVNTGKLAPTGWHVPTHDDWTTLITYLGERGASFPQNGGGSMKSTSTLWISPNLGADNSSGFTGLPGGWKYLYGAYNYAGNKGNWWSSTEYNTDEAKYRYLDYYSTSFNVNFFGKHLGLSVRCVED